MGDISSIKHASPNFILRRCMANCQDLVPKLLDEIQQWMHDVVVPENHIADVQIVLAEALNNVIEHGFEHENTGELKIKMEVSEPRVVVHVSDNGLAFTPPGNSQTPLAMDDNLDALPEGGFGWFLIKEVTTSFEFHRHADRNQLVMYFN